MFSWDLILDIVLDALLDTLKLLPFLFAAYRILGDNNRTKITYQPVDSVIGLGIDVVGASCKHYDITAFLLCDLRIFLPTFSYRIHESVVFAECKLHRIAHFLL